MATPTLVADGILALAIAGVYAFVGSIFARRPVERAESRIPAYAFAGWWIGLAFVTAFGAARSLLGGLDALTLETHVALTNLTLPFLCVALAGLVYYLLYIHSGDKRWLWPVVIFHLLLLAFFSYLVAWLDPTLIEPRAWRVDANNARTLEGPFLFVTLAGLLAPVLLSAAMYGSLFFRTRDPTARYRIGLTSLAFIAWFGTTLLANTLRLSERIEIWPLLARLVGLLAALTVVAAYRPPARIQDRLRRRSLA